MNEKEAIEYLKYLKGNGLYQELCSIDIEAIETVLNIIEKQQAEIEKKDKIIRNSIIEIEKFRQYFSEDLQPDFIRILEILKDKKVIDW